MVELISYLALFLVDFYVLVSYSRLSVMSRSSSPLNAKSLKKILIIEDNSEVVFKIQEILDSSSFKIYAADSSKSGVLLAKEILPDIIFCQYSSLFSHGHCVVSILREAIETKNTPILLLIRVIEIENIRRTFGLGVDDYLIYPFSEQELSSVVDLQIQRYEQQMLQFEIERDKNLQLQRDLEVNQQKLKEVRQFNLIKSKLIGKISTDLRDPLSNINMASRMLVQCADPEERAKYLNILESECTREIQILNEVDTLHSILTLDNMEVLNRFNLLNS